MEEVERAPPPTLRYMKEKILELIKGNAIICSSDIASACSIHESEVRKYINALRCDGFPICANIFGYFIASDKKDIEKTVNSLQSKALSILKSIEGLKTCLKD